ncbi:type II toxin-antitoxin system death-on-curing family toxin [Corynebacterium sp. L4756]|uniref:type II toxin-antitoxin system death-on-curing family toxin n=1 Tax=unclassified Corynebacterium TaxID=2624378 RepID=UPI00374DB654
MKQYCIEPELVIDLNRSFVGTEFNVLDRGKLEGALGVPLRIFGGELLVPSTLGQAAMLIERVANAHAFVDANKRTAWVCGVAYLEHHGFIIARVSDSEVVDLMVSIANNEAEVEEIASWLADRFS